MTAKEVVEKIESLRRITQETGCIARRAQSELLASLPNMLLLEVAPQLNQMFKNERTDRNAPARPRAK